MRIVIKIGTSTLTHAGGRLNIRRTEELCKVISDLKNAGYEIIMVSSGAIGMGVGKLSLPGKPDDMPTKQALAAVGQCELMYTYDQLFSRYNHAVGQIIITAADINDADRYRNFSVTLERLLELGVIPIINENDTIATEEIVIGDNDTLGARVAIAAKADLLVLLSDIEGLYTADPHKDPTAQLVCEVRNVDDVEALAGGAGTARGTGGMVTKLTAARMCMDAGCDMVIANGAKPELLYDVVAGREVGTRFVAKKGE
ncbi:MAG: glutamate 5-kinase [Eggerthellaceae bacterium]|nr:glutamate 5-kinase [Eggerthellaceae bacterium]